MNTSLNTRLFLRDSLSTVSQSHIKSINQLQLLLRKRKMRLIGICKTLQHNHDFKRISIITKPLKEKKPLTDTPASRNTSLLGFQCYGWKIVLLHPFLLEYQKDLQQLMLLYCENHSWLRELLILTFIHLNPSDKKAYSCSANIVASEKYPRWKRRHKVSSIIIRVEVEDQSSKLTTGHCSSLKKQAATRRCGRLEATEMASFDAVKFDYPSPVTWNSNTTIILQF